ncbi:hypothetical protein FRB99_007924 [Tulasnella sp. 403]|nr:hypothetical protein FRB99_007924 [Tulasnella sp. 403]
MVSITFRKQQIFYGVALLLGVLASATSGIINRFNDVDFSTDLRAQYKQLTGSTTATFETNVAFVIVVSILIVADVFRKSAIPVWFELIWTFVFATIEVINVVILANNYPSAHCHPQPSSSLTRRDDVDGSVMGQMANWSPQEVVSKASKEICQNWAAMFAFFVMIAVLLFSQWIWLAVLGLRHRVSNPNFFWLNETPSPFTWRLPPPSESESAPSPVDDTPSIFSFASDEKKAGILVSSPQPIQVRIHRTSQQQTSEVPPKVC